MAKTLALKPEGRYAIGMRRTLRGFDGESLLRAERSRFVSNDIGLPLGADAQL